MPTRQLRPYLAGAGRIERVGDVTRLVLPPTGDKAYGDAQLDDYSGTRPFRFVNRPPDTLRLRARFSHQIGVLKGTAGFGFWNHPLALGGGLIPRSLWFFHGSPESNLQFARGVPGHGFKAGLLDSGRWIQRPEDRGRMTEVGGLPTSVIRPLSSGRRVLRAATGVAIRTAQRLIHARERVLDLDITQWHDYALEWQRDEAVWRIDGVEVFRAPAPPRGPLGFVAWIDNYRAAFTADGRLGFAYVATTETQWLDLTPG